MFEIVVDDNKLAVDNVKSVSSTTMNVLMIHTLNKIEFFGFLVSACLELLLDPRSSSGFAVPAKFRMCRICASALNALFSFSWVLQHTHRKKEKKLANTFNGIHA